MVSVNAAEVRVFEIQFKKERKKDIVVATWLVMHIRSKLVFRY